MSNQFRMLCAVLLFTAACEDPEMRVDDIIVEDDDSDEDDRADDESSAPARQTPGPGVSDPSAVQSGDDEDPEHAVQWCQLEHIDPCIAKVAICSVRCCDDSLFKSPQVCGNCGNWATGVCANHGTRKRIRWEWP